jgi:predicted nuclease of predicted toxin-antitoxin system
MKFLADENIDLPLVVELRVLGYDVLSISESFPSIDDHAVLELARNENRLLITSDKDFGELVYRNRLLHSGILLLRLSDLSTHTVVKVVPEFIQCHETELPHHYCVFAPGHVRIRPLIESKS